MGIVCFVAIFVEVTHTAWGADWVWGVPLIVLTVVIHTFGLGLIGHHAVYRANRANQRHHPTVVFAVVMGTATLLATVLHACEAAIWAFAYRILGALHTSKESMLYSLNAITSYGHTSLELEPHWHLMGALEALNGWLLFGLTTAFLFGMIEKVQSRRRD